MLIKLVIQLGLIALKFYIFAIADELLAFDILIVNFLLWSFLLD